MGMASSSRRYKAPGAGRPSQAGGAWYDPYGGAAAPAPLPNSGYDDFEDPVVRQEDDKEEAELFKDYCMPEEAEEEGTGQEQFVTVLAPQRLRLIGSSRHPGHIVEARTLASVLPPPVTYKLAIWDEMVKEGRAGALSSLQLEAICGACQSHEQMMEDGKHRFGFALGHGTGVGKGRIVAGVVWENFLHGRKKSLWFTASPVLTISIRRDVADLGLGDLVRVNELRSFSVTTTLPHDGILIVTYATLTSKGRLEQLLDWLGEGFDGLIAFDEAHKAKNLIPEKGTDKGSITGEKVKMLQDARPLARFMYCSATIATDVRHLCYMTRLGLWGPGTSFTTMEDMVDQLEKAGIAVMELLAMDLKRNGRYLCQTLGFDEVEFEIVRAPLPPQLSRAYEQSCHLWQYLYEAVIKNQKERSRITSTYWGAHQRFFKSLFVAAKVPFVIQQAKQALAQGHCVVIGLQTTGEAQQKAEGLGKNQADPVGATCQARQILRSFIEKHVEMHDVKVAALAELEKVEDLPNNPLDDLLAGLGGPVSVAELTGRSMQLDETNRYVAKGTSKAAHEAERAAFMRGEKLVAIISEAASVGISLHADRREPNQRRRIHFVIELAWSADRALQQLGRTHRTNQAWGPIYRLVVLDKAGADVRFACSVARRLISLGAIQHGDQRSNLRTLNLKEFNLESKYGDRACHRTMSSLDFEQQDLLAAAGLGNLPRYRCVTKFLNRMLGVPLEDQHEILEVFFKHFEEGIKEDKLNGRYNEGIADLRAEAITMAEPARLFRSQPKPGVATPNHTLKLVTLQSDRGLSWETALAELQAVNEARPHALNGFHVSGVRSVANRIFLAIRRPVQMGADPADVRFKKLTPHTGRDNWRILYPEDLRTSRKVEDMEQARRLWEGEYERHRDHCIHVNCNDPECTDGKRIRNIFVLTGDLINLWTEIRRRLGSRKRLIRVNTTEAPIRRFVGLLLMPKTVDKLKRWLKEVPREVAAAGKKRQRLVTHSDGEEEEADLDDARPADVKPKMQARPFEPRRDSGVFDLTLDQVPEEDEQAAEEEERAAVRAGKRPIRRARYVNPPPPPRQEPAAARMGAADVIDMTLSDDEQSEDEGGSRRTRPAQGKPAGAQVIISHVEEMDEVKAEGTMAGGGRAAGFRPVEHTTPMSGSSVVSSTEDWAAVLDLVDDLADDSLNDDEASALRRIVLDKDDRIAIVYRAALRAATREGGGPGGVSESVLRTRFLRNARELLR